MSWRRIFDFLNGSADCSHDENAEVITGTRLTLLGCVTVLVHLMDRGDGWSGTHFAHGSCHLEECAARAGSVIQSSVASLLRTSDVLATNYRSMAQLQVSNRVHAYYLKLPEVF